MKRVVGSLTSAQDKLNIRKSSECIQCFLVFTQKKRFLTCLPAGQHGVGHSHTSQRQGFKSPKGQVRSQISYFFGY